MNYTAYDRISKREYRMQNLKRKSGWDLGWPDIRWVDRSKPYCRSREKQELRALAA